MLEVVSEVFPDAKYQRCTVHFAAHQLKYPQGLRRLIYITNAIKGFNCQLRKVARAKSVFPTNENMPRMLYLAMMGITGLARDPCAADDFFAERMPVFYCR